MTYDPEIPQTGNLISDSQSDILTNFQQLNLVFGDINPGDDPNSDHYAYDDASANARKHRKVRLVRQAAGAGVPTPAATDGVMYVTAAAAQTIPFYRKDAGVLDFPLLPVRAMIRFTRANPPVVVGTAFNATVASIGGSAFQFLITFTENMPDANYIITEGVVGTSANMLRIQNLLVNSFEIIQVDPNVTELMLVVMHYV